ncbi:MAG: hypothetical protein JO130_15495 [Solirubrobacterales bacterium]|nr:hypothetical protein [Solirubrobacterales bacterium]
MTDSNHAAARARGQAVRSERAARVRKIRRRVISGSVALFVAAWLAITIVLVSGHDPALATRAATTSSVSTGASTPSTTTATSSSGTTSSSSGASSSGSGVSSVTTSQS